ncbi:MAG: hypothetical protein M1816_003330 [Peltula sp. TS41687]|nr:MAG: hypothetical protein M1816_003330 [Peltula sp. TS41687]
MSLDRRQPTVPEPPPPPPQQQRYSPSVVGPAAVDDGSTTTITAAGLLVNSPISRLELLSTRLSMPFVTSISGAVSGIASGLVTCPLDVIKTKLQAQGGFQSVTADKNAVGVAAYRGLVGTARSIWQEEGARGMYRGVFPMILGYFPTWAVYFTVYDRAKEFWYQKLGQEKSERRRSMAHLLTAVTAGACSTIVTNPIWVIKTRLMSQVSPTTQRGGRPPWQYKSTFDAARKMYMNEGFLSFYSGLTPALLGLTHVAVQFPLYEYLKFKFTGLEMGEERKDDRSHWLGMSVATILSKVCASTATYPHEVIRTRLQTQQRSTLTSEGLFNRTEGAGRINGGGVRCPPPRYRGVIHTVKTILREEGWRAFYVGMGTNMIRAVPAATTTILTYEYMVGRIKKLQSEGNRKLDLSAARQVR